MDIFKQRRNLYITIGILVVLNVLLLFTLWNNTSSSTMDNGERKTPEERRSILTKMLKQEFDFSDEQVEQYLRVRFEHEQRIRRIRRKLSDAKKEMFDAVLKENSSATISDSLLKLALEAQGEIESLTYRHFIDLKNICNPEQKEKLQMMMHQVLQPPPGEGMDDRHPPPEGRLPHPPRKD